MGQGEGHPPARPGDPGAVVSRTVTVLLLLALALAMAACGSTSTDEPKKGPAMDERPSMETIVSRYQAMQDDLFATLDQKVGKKPWAEAPNSSGFGRAGCPDDDEAEIAFLPDMSFTGTYDAGDWDEVKTLVEQVGREHGFDDTAVVVDEPGNLDLVGEDSSVAATSSGWRRTPSSG